MHFSFCLISLNSNTLYSQLLCKLLHVLCEESLYDDDDNVMMTTTTTTLTVDTTRHHTSYKFINMVINM